MVIRRWLHLLLWRWSRQSSISWQPHEHTIAVSSGIQRAAQTVLGVYLKRTCSHLTSASSALGVLNDYVLYKSTHAFTHSYNENVSSQSIAVYPLLSTFDSSLPPFPLSLFTCQNLLISKNNLPGKQNSFTQLIKKTINLLLDIFVAYCVTVTIKTSMASAAAWHEILSYFYYSIMLHTFNSDYWLCTNQAVLLQLQQIITLHS